MIITIPGNPTRQKRAEIWKRIDGYPHYSISSEGRVFSFQAYGKGKKRSPIGRILNPRIDQDGYRKVLLRNNPKIKFVKICSLVLEHFDRKRPKGLQCRHLDGDSMNDFSYNLKWGTKLENEDDKRKHGTRVQGEKQWNSKLKLNQVIEIKKLLSDGALSQKEIADNYGVKPCTIGKIKSGDNWRWV